MNYSNNLLEHDTEYSLLPKLMPELIPVPWYKEMWCKKIAIIVVVISFFITLFFVILHNW